MDMYSKEYFDWVDHNTRDDLLAGCINMDKRDPDVIKKELQEKDPDYHTVSLTGRFAMIWDWLTRTYNDQIGISLPPSLYVDGRKPPQTKDAALCGELYTYWASVTSVFEDATPSTPVFHQIRVYPKSIIKEIVSLSGYPRTTSLPTLSVAVDHTLMHETVHYLRTQHMFRNAYDEKNWEANRTLLEDYIQSMNSREDELETEELTLTLLSHMYWNDYELIPKVDGPFIEFMYNKYNDTAKCIVDILRVYTLQHKFSAVINPTDAEVDTFLAKRKELQKKIHQYCKTNGGPYKILH